MKKYKRKVISFIVIFVLFFSENGISFHHVQAAEHTVKKEGVYLTNSAIIREKGNMLSKNGMTETDGMISHRSESEKPATSSAVSEAVEKDEVATAPAIETEVPQSTPVVSDDDASQKEVQKIQAVYTTRMSKTRLKISWKRSENADYYVIYRKKDAGEYQLLTQTEMTEVVDRHVNSKSTFTYRIVPVLRTDGVELTEKSAKIRYHFQRYVSTSHQKYSYLEMQKDLKKLQEMYHDYCRVKSIGKSADKRNLYEVVIGDSDAKKSVLVIAAIHGREYMTSALCMKQIEEYLEHYNGSISGTSVSETLKNTAIHFIPMANPDGVMISQRGISAIKNAALRKKLYKMRYSYVSTRYWKANARGVDLNRNYPIFFRRVGTKGSQGYSGAHSASEPETKAYIKWMNRLKKNTDVKGLINYHAMGRIVFGDAHGKTMTTTKSMYYLARSITGYRSAAGYSYANSKPIGNLREYAMYKKKIPTITLEIGVGRCPLPKWQFRYEWKKNRSLVLQETKMLSKK